MIRIIKIDKKKAWQWWKAHSFNIIMAVFAILILLYSSHNEQKVINKCNGAWIELIESHYPGMYPEIQGTGLFNITYIGVENANQD